MSGKLFSRSSSSFLRSTDCWSLDVDVEWIELLSSSTRLRRFSLSSSAMDMWKSMRLTLCKSNKLSADFRVGKRILFSSWKSDMALNGSSQLLSEFFKCWLSCMFNASRPTLIDIFFFTRKYAQFCNIRIIFFYVSFSLLFFSSNFTYFWNKFTFWKILNKNIAEK